MTALERPLSRAVNIDSDWPLHGWSLAIAEPSVLFLDTFTRGDETSLDEYPPDIGPTWSSITGNIEIMSGAALSGNFASAYVPLSLPDAVVSADLLFTTGAAAGLLFRSDGTLNNGWQLTFNSAGAALTAWVAGLDEYTDFNGSLGDLTDQSFHVEVQLLGNSIRVIVDDTVLWDITSSHNEDGEYNGLFFEAAGGSADNFQITN